MTCWTKVHVSIEDILNHGIDDTIAQINASHNPYSTVDFVACIQPTKLLFSKSFIKLLQSIDLELIPWSISFSSKPSSAGLIHCDYYEDLDQRALGTIDSLCYIDYNTFYRTSLHIDLLGVGSLEWFDLATNSTTLIQTDQTNLPWYKINHTNNHPIKIDSLTGLGVNLCATDVPHRANNLHNSSQRLVLTGRFKNNPTMSDVTTKLHRLIN